eukprot:gb/GFBE01082913.1/.p1 GENE.gb/GFBE01082913.1/~~gb/GFBE01082913.1/.p1  ORF type:complete len:580 (+),score=109.54 gb/GFBE01082913.1/:1-1740(+)
MAKVMRDAVKGHTGPSGRHALPTASRFAIVVLLSCLLVLPARGALTVGSRDTDNLVRKLRQSIFIDTAYLEERPAESTCSSLDGPSCLAALLGSQDRTGGLAALDGPGVIPERLLHDLGVSGPGADFVTPEYSILEAFRRQHEALASVTGAAQMMEGERANHFLADARRASSAGILHFSGMQPDQRVPLTFSRGLPKNVVATWDGRWIVRDCTVNSGSSLTLAEATRALVPAGQEGAREPLAGLLPPGGASSQQVSSVELAGSVGYLRFSHPVSVRSLFARWKPNQDSPAALIGGRLGLDSVWATHLDPDLFQSGNGWIDVGGDPLELVDEVVFIAAQGLEVGAIEVVTTAGADLAVLEEDGEQSILMLKPVPAKLDAVKIDAADEDEKQQPLRFLLEVRTLNGAAAPFIASLQEVIDRNLRLREAPLPRTPGRPRGEEVPGLLSSVLRLHGTPESEADKKFAQAATANEAVFVHRGLEDMAVAGSAARQALAGLHRAEKGALPDDLRRRLAEQGGALVEAVLEHVKAGGWKAGTPSTLPKNGTDDALRRYILAKERQTKLDLLTAAVIYLAPRDAESP